MGQIHKNFLLIVWNHVKPIFVNIHLKLRKIGKISTSSVSQNCLFMFVIKKRWDCYFPYCNEILFFHFRNEEEMYKMIISNYEDKEKVCTFKIWKFIASYSISGKFFLASSQPSFDYTRDYIKIFSYKKISSGLQKCRHFLTFENVPMIIN